MRWGSPTLHTARDCVGRSGYSRGRGPTSRGARLTFLTSHPRGLQRARAARFLRVYVIAIFLVGGLGALIHLAITRYGWRGPPHRGAPPVDSVLVAVLV